MGLVSGMVLLGLSPRVRGNQGSQDIVLGGAGSIPACAGEPPDHTAHLDLVMVYPRVCGGTGTAAARMKSHCGLSPRVRGNQTAVLVWDYQGGSIPACAGEP